MSNLYLWGKPILQPTAYHGQQPTTSLPLSTTIIDLSCGQNCCIVLAEDGVYAVGDNTEGQLGLGTLMNTGVSPIRIEIDSPYKIVEVSCGWHHSLLLDQAGNVFSSGRGDNGELGRDKVRNSSNFGLVLRGARQISAGKDHSLALCGPKVYGWGNSKQGQLGLLNQKNYYRPQELNVYPCSLLKAGNKLSLFITSKGIFGCGLNDQCQLGLGHSNLIQLPRRLSIEQEILQVSVGTYCVAGTKQKEWYLWGNGILGLYRFPTKMTFLQGADSVNLALSSGFFMKKGQLWVWGSNLWGELGNQQPNNDYPVYSEEFSRLGLSGAHFGVNFLSGFSNTVKFDRTRQREANLSSEMQSYPNLYFQNTKQGQSSSRASIGNQKGLFDRYYNVGHSDPIQQHQINRRLYSSQSSSGFETSSALDTSYAAMERTRPQTPKGWVQKKYVKLCNPTKTLQVSRWREQLEKENFQLKERLEFEREQKDTIEQEYLKRVNKYDRNRLAAKISKIESLNHSAKEELKQPHPYLWSSSQRKQPQNISFRPRVIDVDEFQTMGSHINTLKSLIQSMTH